MRRASQAVRGQRRQLLVLELNGLIGLTFNPLTQVLTVGLSPETMAQVIEVVRADLRERQQRLN